MDEQTGLKRQMGPFISARSKLANVKNTRKTSSSNNSTGANTRSPPAASRCRVTNPREIPASRVTKLVPPALTSGKGTPTTGRSPVTIAVLTNI